MKCSASSLLGRRAFLKLSGLATLGTCLPADARDSLEPHPTHRLHIRGTQVELAPGRLITTTTYDGHFPGPLLRATVGQQVRVEVHNETDRAEWINWHGQQLTNAQDAFIPARSRRRVDFTPARPGLYLYHSSDVAATRLDAGSYSGQAGVLLVEPAQVLDTREHEWARECDWIADRESIIVLKDCEPFMRRTRRGCEIGYRSITLNGRLPGHGDFPRTNIKGRVLLQVLNASATETRTLALAGHSFEVTALDGHAVPRPVQVDALQLSPGERVTARIVLNGPEAWTVRSVTDAAGDPASPQWDYARFGGGRARTPDATLDMELTRHDAARSGLNRWSINGSSYSTSGGAPLFKLQRGLRYRLRIHNSSDEVIPVHLQHHRLEIVRVAGQATAGIFKDVVDIGAAEALEVDFVADCPGPALFYCTRQLHRDFGLMARFDYT